MRSQTWRLWITIIKQTTFSIRYLWIQPALQKKTRVDVERQKLKLPLHRPVDLVDFDTAVSAIKMVQLPVDGQSEEMLVTSRVNMGTKS